MVVINLVETIRTHYGDRIADKFLELLDCETNSVQLSTLKFLIEMLDKLAPLEGNALNNFLSAFDSACKTHFGGILENSSAEIKS